MDGPHSLVHEGGGAPGGQEVNMKTAIEMFQVHTHEQKAISQRLQFPKPEVHNISRRRGDHGRNI